MLGVDINAGVVAGATERAARIGAPVTFSVAGLDDLGAGELVNFDVVYSRCMVSHLPAPVPALRSMLAAVLPGGWVLVEDVEVSAVWGSPFEPALARSVELYAAAARGMGAPGGATPQRPRNPKPHPRPNPRRIAQSSTDVLKCGRWSALP